MLRKTRGTGADISFVAPDGGIGGAVYDSRGFLIGPLQGFASAMNFRPSMGGFGKTLRVQVPNNHILTQNLYYEHYYPNPKHLIIGYLDPLGN